MRDGNSPLPLKTLEDVYPAAATAAVALAQLHNTKPDSDWESDAVSNQHWGLSCHLKAVIDF